MLGRFSRIDTLSPVQAKKNDTAIIINIIIILNTEHDEMCKLNIVQYIYSTVLFVYMYIYIFIYLIHGMA